MTLSIIVAVSENGVIGDRNRLPWRLSADLKRFQTLTMGHSLILGRRTYQSIGRPLPGRRMVVVSRNPEFHPQGVVVVRSFEQALETCREESEVFVAGGAAVYRQALPVVDRIYLTRVKGHFSGDTFFPETDWSDWKVTSSESHPADEKNEVAFEFQVLERVS